MSDNRQPRMALLLDDNRGIYIPQGFAQEWAHAFTYPDDPEGYAEDVKLLAKGPHHPTIGWGDITEAEHDAVVRYHEAQMDAWNRILDNAVGKEQVRDKMRNIIDNPWAGWRLDQGWDGVDGCVRTYHPDDVDLFYSEEE